MVLPDKPIVKTYYLKKYFCCSLNISRILKTISNRNFPFPVPHRAGIRHLLSVGVWLVGGFCQQPVPF